jgi:hypothetical protein
MADNRNLNQFVGSIRIKHLEVLVKEFVKAMRQEGRAEPRFGFTSHDLKEYFIENNIHPPETYRDRGFFSNEMPLVTVTYMWSVVPVEKLLQILMERFDSECLVFVDIIIYRQRPNLDLFAKPDEIDFRLLILYLLLFRTICLADIIMMLSLQLQIQRVSASLDRPRIY